MELLKDIKNVSLYGSRQQEGHISAIWELIVRLEERDIKVSVERKLAEVLESAGYRLAVHGVRSCTRLPEGCGLAVSIGGDGTFLRTARWLGGRETPILGINTGHLGYLAENSTDNVEGIVSLITSGEACIERRLVLEAEYTKASGETVRGYALNEVAFLKGAASMIDVDVALDRFHLATYRADGLLVATPTGSTAYNLSVGGPILAPTLQSIILSPIAPHTLTLRPLVAGGNSLIEARVTSREPEFRLSVDGRSADIHCGSMVRIKKAPFDVLTVRRPGDNFASTLRSKLFWGH